jgi:hypothetical protein
MFKAFLGAVAMVAVAGFAPKANAAIVFSDNFNSESHALNYTGFANWDVTAGSVDLIGAGFFNLYPGHGNFVDLDGSTHVPGQMTSDLSFAAGGYTLSFDLGGNARGAVAKTTEISFGDISRQITLAATAGLTHQSFRFNTTGGNLIFTELGKSDLRGNILDNVTLASGVPEPSTWAMMLIGFAGVGLQLRRRQRVISVTA